MPEQFHKKKENKGANVRLLFAPMEGITYAAFRMLHHTFFPGAAEYFTPFIAPDNRGSFKSKYLKELTDGYLSAPQLLVNNAGAFNKTARKLYDLGFQEINLNIGCPSNTVYAKHKGAGMLRDLTELSKVLEEIFEQAEQIGYRVSIKSRMGDHCTDEFPEIMKVYNIFPISRLIVHARCRDDFYQGAPDVQGFRAAFEMSRFPLIYNGSISSAAELRSLLKTVPVDTVMIGRGVVKNPALFRELTGGSRLTPEELQNFLNQLTATWLESGLSPSFTLERMKTLWIYMRELFPNEKKQIKAILKSKYLEEYQILVSGLLRNAVFDCDN